MAPSLANPVSNRLPFTSSSVPHLLSSSLWQYLLQRPLFRPDLDIVYRLAKCTIRPSTADHKMCCGCWPFADVWLEEPPKPKKKEEKKGEEKTEWVCVPDGVAFYPVSHMHIVYPLLSSVRRVFSSLRQQPFSSQPNSHIINHLHSSQPTSRLHNYLSLTSNTLQVIMNIYTYVPPQPAVAPQPSPASQKPHLYTYVPPTQRHHCYNNNVTSHYHHVCFHLTDTIPKVNTSLT